MKDEEVVGIFLMGLALWLMFGDYIMEKIRYGGDYHEK